MNTQTYRFWMGLFVITALLWAGLGGQALAVAPSDQSAIVNVTATVSTLFELACNKLAVTLTSKPGSTVSDTVIWIAKHNCTSAVWLMKNSPKPCLNGRFDLGEYPLADFLHNSVGGLGTLADSSDTAFTISPVTYYTAAWSEKKNLSGGMAITTTYKVNIPNTQAAETYTAIDTHTLTIMP